MSCLHVLLLCCFLFFFLHNLSVHLTSVELCAAGTHSGAKILQAEVKVVPANWQGIHPVNGVVTKKIHIYPKLVRTIVSIDENPFKNGHILYLKYHCFSIDLLSTIPHPFVRKVGNSKTAPSVPSIFHFL